MYRGVTVLKTQICLTRPQCVNIQKFYFPTTQRVPVFCMDLTINGDYFPVQHQQNDLYN